MLQKLTKALEHPKAKEILDILNNLTGMQLLFGIEQVKELLCQLDRPNYYLNG